MEDDVQAKALEEKLKSQLRLLELEHAVFERMVYKNKNQHRRCSYFQYLLKVRRDLRLLRTANMEEILRPCFHVIAGTGAKQKLHVLESLKLKKSPSILDRLRGALHLLSQMTEPILKAASGISVLLACSFFIGSSMTFLALLARLRVLIQQILLDAVSVFNSVTSTSLKKQSVKIAQDGVEVFREFYPKDEGCFTLLDCVWKTDKYVLIETLQNRESSKPTEENVSEDVTTRDSLVQYQTSVSSLGVPLAEDLSPLPEADDGGVTVTESSTPIAESASSKTNNALQPEVSENTGDDTTRDCSIQYQTSVSLLGEDLSPLPEAGTGGVTVIESSTPNAETALSKANSALQPEDAATRGCSIQYETSVSLLGEDISPPLPEADKDGGVIVTESSTPIAEAASDGFSSMSVELKPLNSFDLTTRIFPRKTYPQLFLEEMEVKVATTTSFHWSGRHAAMPKCPSFSQTINSSKRRRYCRRDVYTSVVGGGGGSLSCQTRLNPSTFLGTESGKLHRSKSCELLKFTKNRTGMQKHYPLRRVCSASSSFFSDQDFSAKMQELALQFKIAGEEEDLERNKYQSERIHDKVKLLQEYVPGLASLEAPWIEMVNHSSIEGKANSVNLPLSLRMIKRKLQEQALKEASDSNNCSIYKAFSSMVFMIDELRSFALQTRETIFYEEDLQSVVKKDMHASLLWIFQSVFSQTPTLMVYVMILLANFTVHSVASNLAVPASPVTEGQDQTHQRFESTLLSHVVSGNFDKISGLSTQGIREDGLSLWNSMVEEADQMQDSPVVRDIRLSERIELDDHARTESVYEISLVQEPNNPLLLANYAQFLYLISQDYDRAEICFKKAIESEEVDAETYSKYAVFQWRVLNDIWAAEENFLEAISADPTNSYYAANYANFLWQTGGEETCYPLESSDSPQ